MAKEIVLVISDTAIPETVEDGARAFGIEAHVNPTSSVPAFVSMLSVNNFEGYTALFLENSGDNIADVDVRALQNWCAQNRVLYGEVTGMNSAQVLEILRQIPGVWRSGRDGNIEF
jgi:hypothetical protein